MQQSSALQGEAIVNYCSLLTRPPRLSPPQADDGGQVTQQMEASGSPGG
jgi:hypothetical protein